MISTAVPQVFGKIIHIFSDIGTNTPRLLHDLNLIRPNQLVPLLKVCRPIKGPWQNLHVERVG